MKLGEDRVREKMGGDFDKLGLGKGGAEVIVGALGQLRLGRAGCTPW